MLARQINQSEDDRAFAEYMETMGLIIEQALPTLRSHREAVVQPRSPPIVSLPILAPLRITALFESRLLMGGLDGRRAMAYLSIVRGMLRAHGIPYRQVQQPRDNIVIYDADTNVKLVWTHIRQELKTDASVVELDAARGYRFDAVVSRQPVIDIRCSAEFAAEFQEFLPR